ncbi:MAG TPA: hypothetical protein VG713_19615 [Pirellulales bacterium]|nr:hypothetical protein [Pirellulales bacterium]
MTHRGRSRRGWSIASFRREYRLAGVTVVLVGALLSGCKSPFGQPSVQNQSQAGGYHSARIAYRVDAGRLCEPMALARIDGQLVSYEDHASSPVPGTSRATLTIEYPHPAGIAGYAQARVDIDSVASLSTPRPGSSIQVIGRGMKSAAHSIARPWLPDDRFHETWTLDVPKVVIDQAIGELNQSGFFAEGAPRSGAVAGVKLSATVDAATVRRAWRQSAALDALMLEVRRSGQLEAYHRPADLFRSGGARFSSVGAYCDFARSRDDAHQWLAASTGLAPNAAAQTAAAGVDRPESADASVRR